MILLNGLPSVLVGISMIRKQAHNMVNFTDILAWFSNGKKKVLENGDLLIENALSNEILIVNILKFKK